MKGSQDGIDRGHVAVAERRPGSFPDWPQPVAVGHGVPDKEKPGSWGDFHQVILKPPFSRSIPGG